MTAARSGFRTFLWCLFCAGGCAAAGPPEAWIPARWQGGPLELARRARNQTAPADAAARDAIRQWYDTATLELLKDTPVNCLLVTWSAGADAALERQQQQLLKAYTSEAHQRGIAVLGLVYPGSDPSQTGRAAADARLDGLAPEGDFPDGAGFVAQLEKALAAAGSAAVVIPIAPDTTAARRTKGPLPAVRGVSPSARNLADMGIRGTPSSEPWIESNVWLVRSFRFGSSAWRPVWISQQPAAGSAGDYVRSVADAALAGGRWMVALDDNLRAGLRGRDPAALAAWRRVGAYLKFAEEHAEWRSFAPYGNLGIVVDWAGADQDMADEYLKLVARRQVPYRLIARSELGPAALAGFRAVLATALAPPTDAERSTLRSFAERGGLVVVGPGWGNPPKDEPYSEIAVGEGRLVVYKDPDPDSVARDVRDLLSQEEAGVVAFNVPPVITYAGAAGAGRRVLVQLLNYSNTPAEAITIRVNGKFKAARFYAPEAAPSDLALRLDEGKTDVSIPRLPLWGAVLLE